VATRIERLKQVARYEPKTPALKFASQDEVDAAIVLSKSKHWKMGARLNVEQFVGLVAEVGGYSKWSGGPPGSITIGRGLELITAAAVGIAAMRNCDEC
jgi:hypothetical protein